MLLPHPCKVRPALESGDSRSLQPHNLVLVGVIFIRGVFQFACALLIVPRFHLQQGLISHAFTNSLSQTFHRPRARNFHRPNLYCGVLIYQIKKKKKEGGGLTCGRDLKLS